MSHDRRPPTSEAGDEFVLEIEDGSAQDEAYAALERRKVGPFEVVVRNVAAVFMTAVVVVVLIGVVARYLLQISLPWAEEVARLLLVWLTFAGAALATAQRTNLRVDTIYGRLKPGPRRRAFEAFSVVMSILALGVLMYASIDLFGPSAATRSPGSGIQAVWTRVALPIASVVMVAFLVVQLRAILTRRDDEDPELPAPRDEV